MNQFSNPNNLADIIEKWILRKLSGQDGEIIILKRNEMATELDCAPSQISYVLSTRFTFERGFIVESRRGSGGFVRVARVPVQRRVFEEAAEQISSDITMGELIRLVERLRDNNLMTNREAALMLKCLTILYERVKPAERIPLLRSLLETLAEHN
ncbi:MAG TPA: CtsR family transcriptional regulator [Methylomusa anaerophila]|uniref:Transcriptional regulator CtsR n=1 Tax=Methylomusa anaerophila TaxID=1930071 RepID=A0A348AJR8_9FIRM|nr:CtsR family transcriptional regulator [Methylomusa anaerophila]BBB91316.1 transcriptional regulator CtsR [Methylomusa anaerophila]HML90509.1 CtsR family transcriptional regulator [Methylomusa anaerophila]